MTDGGLKRELGIGSAVLLGLGSILGTGVFVSVCFAADIAGTAALPAILVGAIVASFNGLSSAQLAANHPVSGGTYEYGYRWLNPLAGFTAGWMFLCAKSASAASAALGCAMYLLRLFDFPETQFQVPLALILVAAFTALVCLGIRRSSQTNTVIVTVTVCSLLALIMTGLYQFLTSDSTTRTSLAVDLREDFSTDFFYASALMFVAYTGYGRIATMGEEVVDPSRTIPTAIISTLVISAILYLSVGFVVIVVDKFAVPAKIAGTQIVTLQDVGVQLDARYLATIISIGAVTAMMGVLLNLVLGLSRVVLAMSRRNDLPATLSVIHDRTGSPLRSIIAVGTFIGLLGLIGDLKVAWSLSALTVLIYYAITNAAAIALRPQERLYPQWVSWAGLISCLSLSLFIPLHFWCYALGLMVVGFLIRWKS